MTTKTRRLALVGLLVGALLLPPRARATGPARAPIRLMTYNTALMNLEADITAAIGQWSIPISYDVNKDGYGGQPYNDRVQMMVDQIRKEDPDVVVLNEVWNDDQKQAFVDAFLANNSPYTSYIKKIQGKAPGIFNAYAEPGITTANIIDLVSNLLGTGAGQAIFDFFANMFCPIIPGLCPIGSVDIHLQDSGIMLFSRHPFVKFDGPTFPGHPGVVIEGANGNQGWGAGKRETAVAVYQVARGMDELAAKAAGMVRIQLAPGSIADIVFSHTNADEQSYEENADVRAYQMNQVRKMVTRALSRDELANEQVYMLGDLNTPGHNKKTGNVEEWSTLFGNNAQNSPWKHNPQIFFACGEGPCTAVLPNGGFDARKSYFTDAWGFETSTADESKSNYIDGNYYDYVLHNNPPRQCMQYIRIGSEMQDNVTGVQLSDHLPIHVDFNLDAPRCTPDLDKPNGATVVDLSTDHHVETFDQNREARITHPGSMQWYYLPEPGTYWVNIVQNASHVSFDVFAEDDLSDPIPPFHGETDPRKGKRFVTYKPIYVRAYAVDANGNPDRNWVGPYSIQLWRATGATPDDSIEITPAEHWKYDWASVTNQPTVWFDFYTNQTRAQEFAHTTIIHEIDQAGVPVGNAKWDIDNELWVMTGQDPYNMASYTSMNQQLQQANPNAPDFKDFVNPDMQANPLQNVTGWQVEMPDLPGEPSGPVHHDPKKYFYKVTQDGIFGQPPQDLHSHLLLLTDLQYLSAVGFQSTGSLYDDNEPMVLGFDFDGTSQGDYCQGMPNGPWGSDCIVFPMFKPGVVVLPSNIDEMMGPFRVNATPTVWVFDPKNPGPPTQIGRDGDGGSDIQDGMLYISRWDVGQQGCLVTKNHTVSTHCLDLPISSPNSPNVYSYHLYYGITHDKPDMQP